MKNINIMIELFGLINGGDSSQNILMIKAHEMILEAINQLRKELIAKKKYLDYTDPVYVKCMNDLTVLREIYNDHCDKYDQWVKKDL